MRSTPQFKILLIFAFLFHFLFCTMMGKANLIYKSSVDVSNTEVQPCKVVKGKKQTTIQQINNPYHPCQFVLMF